MPLRYAPVAMQIKKFEPNDVIFHEGEDSQAAYWISSGRVGVTVKTEHGQKMLAQLGPGQLFGEMGLIDDLPRSATARALEPTELEVIDEDTFDDVVLGRPERLRRYLATLFERIRTADTLLQAEINKRSGASAAPASVEGALAGAFPADAGGDAVAGGAEGVSVEIVSQYDKTGLKATAPIKLTVAKFPFLIGRKVLKGMTPFALNDLELDDPAPYNVSRNHLSIEQQEDRLFVRDRGSTLGTIVNGKSLSVREGEIIAELKPGKNELTVGNERSPHFFEITVQGA